MGDAVDKIHEISIWGYIFGVQMYPFLKSSLATNIILTTIVAAIAWKLALALFDEDDSPIRALIFAIVGTAIVQVTLYNPITFKLDQMVPLAPAALQAKKTQFGTDEGMMAWPSYYADRFMNSWIDFAMAVANPDNKFMFAGAPVAAAAVAARQEAVNDPQIRSALSQWQNVIAPSYLLTNPALMARVKAEGLEDMLLYPGTSASDLGNAPLAVKARKLKDILENEPSLDLVGAVRSLSGHLNDPATRLNGSAFTLDPGGTEVVAPMLSDYTLNAPVAPATAPANYSPRAVKAYDAGRKVLMNVANDANRQPPASIKNFAELYKAIGDATDVAVARDTLRDPENVMAFGTTCQSLSDDACKQALTNASTNMAAKGTWGWDNNTESAKRFAMGLATTLGSSVDRLLLKFISTQVPVFIGAAKSIVTIATPIMLIVMLWPGRFQLGLSIIIGGYVLVGMWASFYILWQWMIVGLMFTNGSVLPDFENYSALVKVQAAGLGALGVLSWMIVFGGFDKAHRNLTPASGGIGSGMAKGISGAGQSLKGMGQAGAGIKGAIGKFMSKNP